LAPIYIFEADQAKQSKLKCLSLSQFDELLAIETTLDEAQCRYTKQRPIKPGALKKEGLEMKIKQMKDKELADFSPKSARRMEAASKAGTTTTTTTTTTTAKAAKTIPTPPKTTPIPKTTSTPKPKKHKQTAIKSDKGGKQERRKEEEARKLEAQKLAEEKQKKRKAQEAKKQQAAAKKAKARQSKQPQPKPVSKKEVIDLDQEDDKYVLFFFLFLVF
jgi:hypothetical protein